MLAAMMLRSRALRALFAAVLCSGTAQAEPLDLATEQQGIAEESQLLSGDEPIDLSTPLPDPGSGRAITIHPSATSAARTDWEAKVGVDYRRPSYPAADWQPDQLLAGSVENQSTGVAWANVTAPGPHSPLGWDKTAIETRLDPSQDQGKIVTTLSRSVPVEGNFSITLQNSYAITLAPAPAASNALAQSWATHQALHFNVLPTDTTLSLGTALSSTEDKWLRTLSAEQKLFGGPVSVTGSLSETGDGDTSKSLKAGFRRTW